MATDDPSVNEAPKGGVPAFDNRNDVPTVYFDMAPAHGVMAGAVQIELAARVLIPHADDSVEVRFVTCGRLRCSPSAPAKRDRRKFENAGAAARQRASRGLEAELRGQAMWAETACTALQSGCGLRLQYDGYTRDVEVHAVGITKEQHAVMRVWQVGGGSVSHEPVGWKLLRLDEASGALVTKQRSLAPRNGYKRNDKVMSRIQCQL
jgi:hypothetical protein